MSVPKTIPYISLRDICIATTDGYAIGFVAGIPIEVPNFKNVLREVQAAGCVPYNEGDGNVKPMSRTPEHVSEAALTERAEALRAAILVIVDRDMPVDFNRMGSPQVRSLETITGFDKVSNTERDAAWAAYKASQNE